MQDTPTGSTYCPVPLDGMGSSPAAARLACPPGVSEVDAGAPSTVAIFLPKNMVTSGGLRETLLARATPLTTLRNGLEFSTVSEGRTRPERFSSFRREQAGAANAQVLGCGPLDIARGHVRACVRSLRGEVDVRVTWVRPDCMPPSGIPGYGGAAAGLFVPHFSCVSVSGRG